MSGPEALAAFAESARSKKKIKASLRATEETSPIPTDSRKKDRAATEVLQEGVTGTDHGAEEAIDELPDQEPETKQINDLCDVRGYSNRSSAPISLASLLLSQARPHRPIFSCRVDRGPTSAGCQKTTIRRQSVSLSAVSASCARDCFFVHLWPSIFSSVGLPGDP